MILGSVLIVLLFIAGAALGPLGSRLPEGVILAAGVAGCAMLGLGVWLWHGA